MTRSKEEYVAMGIALYFKKEYGCGVRYVQEGVDSYIYIYNEEFDLLITVCNASNGKCIKIEDIVIEEPFRNKGVLKGLLNILKGIADEQSVKLGLWCELNNKRLFDFYIKSGFKYVETLDDHWLCYN